MDHSLPEKSKKRPLSLQAKMPSLVRKAVEENWTMTRLGKEAGCTRNTASKYFRAYLDTIERAEAEVADSLPEMLKEEALACTRSAAARLRGHRDCLDRLLAQLEAEDELDPRAVSTALQAEEKFTGQFRRITGMDFAEKQAVAQAGKTEVSFVWQGAEAFDMNEIIDLPE